MNKHNDKKEQGLVSIISVIIIIIIISVISLSLAALTRRSLRQSIDEQLSAQAQYAAETGINDAISKIISGDISGVTDCDDFNTKINKFSPNLSDDGSVRYTCVLVDQSPTSIVADVSNESMKVYPLIDSNGKFISSLNITWKRTDSTTPSFPLCTLNSSSTNGCLSDSATWATTNRLGLLGIRLIPFPATGTNYTDINANTINIIAYPFAINSTPAISSTSNATSKDLILAGNCSSNSCSITINSLYYAGTNALPGRYYVQLYSYYLASNITVNGTVSDGNPIYFSQAQTVIDSTGAAQDIVKRVRASVSLDKTSTLPVYSLNVGEKLCKRFYLNSTTILDQGSSDSPACASF